MTRTCFMLRAPAYGHTTRDSRAFVHRQSYADTSLSSGLQPFYRPLLTTTQERITTTTLTLQHLPLHAVCLTYRSPVASTHNHQEGIPLYERVPMASSMGKRWIVSRPLCSVRDAPQGHRATRHLRPPWRWLQHRGKTRGDDLGSSGQKHQTGAKERASIAQHGFVLGPIAVKPVNKHDTLLLPATLTTLVAWTSRRGSALTGSALTLAAGFDSQANRDAIKDQKRTPVIDPNRHQTQHPIKIAPKFR